MSRRTILALAAAAMLATATGTGVRLWRVRREDDDDASDGTVATDVWSLSFARLDGSTLSMAGLRGKPLLLNFWATWCAPCIVEMPLLDRFAREHGAERWNVLALAVDQPDPVRRFIAERTLRLPIAMAGAAGLDLSRQLGNRNGGLPFTAAFGANGGKLGQHLGAVSAELLASWNKSAW